MNTQTIADGINQLGGYGDMSAGGAGAVPEGTTVLEGAGAVPEGTTVLEGAGALSDGLHPHLHLLAAEAGKLQEFGEPSWIAAIVAGLLAIAGAVFIFVSARAMYLAPDALSQVNMVGPAVGVGLPLLICANLVYTFSVEGFVLGYLIRAIIAITGLLVVGAVGSYVMGRALHATHWDHTVPLSGGQRVEEPK